MIQKLRKKLILISMAAFLSVLLIIISAINIVNYGEVVQDADELLEVLSENHGNFPTDSGHNRPNRPNLSPETPFETRFFSVMLQSDSGEVSQTDTSRIFSVSHEAAIAYAEEVYSSGEESGFLKNFRFSAIDDGETVLVIFLDCSRSLDSFYRFLFASIIISFVGFGVVFVLIAFFSNRIIRPIVESYEKQKRFITDAGHELKTPLTIINADTDVLEMEYGSNEWLEDIQKQTGRLKELTNHLVELAKLEEASYCPQKVEFPLSDVVSEAADSFIPLAQMQNKTLALQIEPLLSYDGDAKSLSQLVGVLLDNALKYSPQNSKIDLTLQKQGAIILLSVRNSTHNRIEKGDLSKLFDRFYRIDASHNSETGGYGIGLSIAKAIVTAHNGKIQATCDDDTTLTITASLPI